MTKSATISGGGAHRRSMNGAGAPQNGRWLGLLRSALSGTRLLDRVVRSLFRRDGNFVTLPQISTSFLLLKPAQALMLAGIRCAGAGGGGPGR